MCIKRYVTAILFLLVFLQVKATGLSCDVIQIKGENWFLMARPIETDSILYARLKEFIPKNHCMTTANWDGYTAFWEIEDEYLYLQRIEVCVYDEANKKDSTMIFDADRLESIFAPYYEEGKICARWVSGKIRAGQGDLLRYENSAFDRNMEIEQVVIIKNGKVLQSSIYHNYKKDGLNLMHAQDEIVKRFPWEWFPQYQGQRLVFSMGNFRMTEDGHLLDVDVNLIKPESEEIRGDNPSLIKAFKETLKSIYPWETFYINGEYTMAYSRMAMSIKEKEVTIQSGNDNL